MWNHVSLPTILAIHWLIDTVLPIISIYDKEKSSHRRWHPLVSWSKPKVASNHMCIRDCFLFIVEQGPCQWEKTLHVWPLLTLAEAKTTPSIEFDISIRVMLGSAWFHNIFIRFLNKSLANLIRKIGLCMGIYMISGHFRCLFFFFKTSTNLCFPCMYCHHSSMFSSDQWF